MLADQALAKRMAGKRHAVEESPFEELRRRVERMEERLGLRSAVALNGEAGS